MVSNRFIIVLWIVTNSSNGCENSIFLYFTEKDIAIVNVCNPSPCGVNAVCKEVNDQPVCSCLPNYLGAPPNCKSECVVNSECKPTRACVNQRCINPCPKPCGQNTECKVINHSPVCSCKSGFSGNAFTMCSRVLRKLRFNVFSKNIYAVFIIAPLPTLPVFFL